MIPSSLSGETEQDSEPHLTVNQTNPNQIVGTAFSPNPGAGALGPIYFSLDGGNTWTLNAIVPSTPGSDSGTLDITTSFNRNGSELYAGILRDSTLNLEFLRTNTPFGPTPMTVLASRPKADQPFTHATTVTSGSDAGKDQVYIGDNDFSPLRDKTATVDQSLNAGIASPTFSSVRIEKRRTTPGGQDGPQIRPVAHTDGTVYAAFYGWRSRTGSFPANTLVITSADVVVVRDDKWGADRFTDLKGPVRAGIRVVQNVSFPFMSSGTAATGQQRIGGAISIAVDPRSSSIVYLVWGDSQTGSFLTLHVRRSLDRGLNWSASDLRTIPNATNPALAIDNNGTVGFLYQQLTGTGANQRWATHLERTDNAFGTRQDLVLANVPATQPVKIGDPYLGDYDHLVAVGQTFFGIFSANNEPNLANFPNGVKYQRNADFTTHQLLGVNNVTPVGISIDPFFFKIPTFSISLSPNDLKAVQESHPTVTVGINRDLGFTDNVNLELISPNPQITGAFTNNPCSTACNSSTLSLNVPGSVTPGDYTLSVRASGGSITRSANLALRVRRFILSLSQSDVFLSAGAPPTSVTVTITRAPGFTGPVALSLEGLPQGTPLGGGIGHSFSPPSTTGNTSTLSLHAGHLASAGEFHLTVHGTSDSLSDTVSLSAEVLGSALP